MTTIVSSVIALSFFYETETSISDGSCNIAVLPIEGVVLPYHGIGGFEMVITPEEIDSFMEAAENDENIKAVLIEVNSPGGTPVASERIGQRLQESTLPIVALIGDTAASGGYMIASAADYLIASAMSDVGSIGVTMSYVEESKKNEEEGLTYVQLTTGKFKDIGSPNRAITDEERELLTKDLQLVHDEFVRIVANNRNLSLDSVQTLADGSTMPGIRAVEAGLVDELGNRGNAKNILATTLGIEASAVTFCEFESGFLPFY